MKKEVNNVTTATHLYEVQQKREALEQEEKELKKVLLDSLKKQGVKSVKLENGTTFTRSHRESLKVVDEVKAKEWAQEHYCLKIDTTKAMQILRREFTLPDFFTRSIGEDYLTIKR